jgi:hypothetical protein
MFVPTNQLVWTEDCLIVNECIKQKNQRLQGNVASNVQIL